MPAFENRKGTYALVFACNQVRPVLVGKLGTMALQTGYYIYIGSAFGPGGIRARMHHHLKVQTTVHWHVDYLKPHCSLREVWVDYSPRKTESHWAGKLVKCNKVTIPMTGFGASDAASVSHLFYSRTRPEPTLLPSDRLRIYRLGLKGNSVE